MVNKLRAWLAERAGFYRESPDYIRALRKIAIQEIIYGESLIAIAFAVYTYVYSVSLISVLTVFAASFALAGYHIWRPYHLRLQPKMEFFSEAFQQLTPTVAIGGSTVYTTNFVQVLPRCLTDTPIENCRGRLLRVLRYNNGNWEATALNEPLDLVWSFHDSKPLTIEPGVDQRLNVRLIDPQQVVPAVEPNQLPIREGVFAANATFRFDVRVSGKDCPPIDISVIAHIGQQTPERVNARLPYPVAIGIENPSGHQEKSSS